MKWSEDFIVRFHDTLEDETVGAPQIIKYIQECAMCQISRQKPTYKDLLSENKAYILSSIRVELYSQINAFQNIHVSTWACESRGFNFTRGYSIESEGEVVCEAMSNWALVKTDDKKLIKVSDIDLSNYSIDDPLTLDHSTRLHIPSDLPMSLVGEYSVKYTDIDFNNHMNNTNYAGILINYIPNIENYRIKSIGISFVSECKYHEVIKIYMSKVDNSFYFRTVRSDGKTNIEAELITEEK